MAQDNFGAKTATDPITSSEVLGMAEVDSFVRSLDTLESPSASLEGRVAKNATTAAVILAGGSGERFGNPDGKQLFDLLGKPVLSWSAETFDAVPDVGLIVIVCPDERREEFCKTAIDPYPFATPIEFASAGSIRQESAMNGIAAVPSDYKFVAVHDGARPLITAELVEHAINALKGDMDADGIVVGHPSIDTLKVVDGRSIAGTPDRNMFWVAQTPQIFHADILRRAYTTAMYEGFVGTDDSSLVERMGRHVRMLDGPRDNIKVTVPEDVGPVIAALTARLRAREGL